MSLFRLLGRFVALVLPALLIVVSVFTACEKEVEKIVTKTDTLVVHDTVTVEIMSVSVDSVVTDLDNITQGLDVTLTAMVSKNANVGALEYSWFVNGGSLNMQVGDTVVWTTPDDPNTYKVTVHATDGEFIAVGSRLVGVGMYAATVTPYYVGDARCATCHSGTHGDWEETGHAEAWASLMTSDHAASYCFPCHAVGYEGDFGNSGYDEAPIEKFVNVQCENCHGAGSAHAEAPSSSNISFSYEADNCGKCHEGTHHPYVTEWAESRHAFAPENHGAEVGSCMGCHEGVAGAVRLSGDLSAFYGSGSVVDRPDTTDIPVTAITCQVCHNSHDATNPGQVRTVADVPLITANGESPVITEGGVGKLCMHCHHARRGAESQLDNGYSHFGPHSSPQGDMMAGKSAYHGVADASFPWAQPSHLNVQNSCKTCHINMVEYDGNTAITGHTFEPTVAACENCHGQIADFDDIKALEDFDGDGTVEGIQSEVAGLLHMLEEALVADGLDTTGVGVASALGDTARSTYKQREAGYNYMFVEDDQSHGIHNPDYAVQLLQQSYEYLTNTKVPNAVILKNQKAVAADW